MSSLRDLGARARGGWLAVVVMGLVVLGAVPFYAGFADGAAAVCGGGTYCLSSGPGRLGRLAGGESRALGLYWLVAVPVAYALLSGWFAARARRTGLQQRWGAYIAAGLLGFAVLAASAMPASDPLPYGLRALTTPLLMVAASLAVLGRVERDARLVILAAGAAAIAMYAGFLKSHPFVLPDDWPAEPLVSAALSPQGALAVLGAVMVACGTGWSFRTR